MLSGSMFSRRAVRRGTMSCYAALERYRDIACEYYLLYWRTITMGVSPAGIPLFFVKRCWMNVVEMLLMVG